jgi:hypothetical protein
MLLSIIVYKPAVWCEVLPCLQGPKLIVSVCCAGTAGYHEGVVYCRVTAYCQGVNQREEIKKGLALGYQPGEAKR